MTDKCTIGPVSILDPHLFENNKFSFSNSAVSTVASGSTITTKGQYTEELGFDIIMTIDEALQVRGVVEMGEIVWLDTSSDLTDNNYFQHKGWVLLTSMVMEHLNPTYMTCSISYIKISDHADEYLTMDYTRGIYDGVNIEPTYDITSTVYDLQEDGSDATTNFSTIREYPTAATTSWATDGAEWDLAVASGTDGTSALGWVMVDTMTFTPPFTLDTALDFNTVPGAASYPANIGILITPHDVASGSAEFINKALGDYFEFQWNLTNTTGTVHAAYIGKGGTVKWMSSGTSTGVADADIGVRLQFDAEGKVRIYYDDDATLASPTQLYYGPHNIVNWKNGLRVYLYVKNRDSTSFTGSFHFLNIYNSDEVTFPNIVHIPYNSTAVTTVTGTRAGEDGNISYYTDPTTELRYTVAKADYYKGSVKLLSTNNTGASSRQVFGTNIKLTPTTTTLKNAFTQLTFDADEVIISGYDGGWQEINRIHYTADIDLIRPLYISSEKVVLQINSTKWTMLRSSPIVTVEHPTEILQYTLRDRYVTGSGTTSAPAADADIDLTADTDYYVKIHDNASDSYSLVLGFKDPTTIKSDSIPVASNPVGIGWFNKAASGINAADSLIQQWYRQTRTGISLKQIV
jgi:hypothetical protein